MVVLCLAQPQEIGAPLCRTIQPEIDRRDASDCSTDGALVLGVEASCGPQFASHNADTSLGMGHLTYAFKVELPLELNNSPWDGVDAKYRSTCLAESMCCVDGLD